GNRAARTRASHGGMNRRGILPRSCEIRSSPPHGVVQSRISYQPKIKKIPGDLARRTTSGLVADPVDVENAQGGRRKMERMAGTREHMAGSPGVIPTRSDPRVLLLAGPGLTSVAVTLPLPAIHQWGSYHNFADTRGFRYLPNALNVLSNIPFLIVGALGLAFVSDRPLPSSRAGNAGRPPSSCSRCSSPRSARRTTTGIRTAAAYS